MVGERNECPGFIFPDSPLSFALGDECPEFLIIATEGNECPDLVSDLVFMNVRKTTYATSTRLSQQNHSFTLFDACDL